MTELTALNVRITGDAGDLRAAVGVATGELGKVAAAADRAQTGTGRLARGFDDTASSAGRGGQALRGMTQQLSQVGQQTMATGNFIQALAIQLPDIGLAFGAVGTAAGLLAGIALPMVISAFGGTSTQAAALQTSLDALTETTDAYSAAVSELKTPAEEMIATYGRMSSAARDFAAAMAEIARVSAFDALTASITTLTQPMINLQQFADDGTASWYLLAESLGISEAQANSVASALQYLANANGPEAQARAAQDLAQRLLDAAGSYEKMSAEARRTYDAAVQIGAQAAKIAAEVDKSEAATNRLALAFGAVGSAASSAAALVSGIGSAAEGALPAVSALASKMWEAAQAKVDAAAWVESQQPGGAGDLANQYKQYGMGRTAFNKGAQETLPFSGANPVTPSAGGGGGGGGGGTNPLQGELEALQQSLLSQEQIEAESHMRRLETLKSALDQRLLTQQEYAALMEQVERTHQFAMGKETREGISATLTALGGLFEGSKKIGAAIGLANSWLAFTEVLKDPAYAGRPWARFAAAASALSSGLNAVRNIKSASPGGATTGGGGGAMGGAAAGGGGPLQVNLNTFGGGDFIRAADFGMILDKLNKEAGDRGYTILGVPA